MLVFSSAHNTYSSGPSGRPSQMQAYRSSTRLALVWKSGSRMKIQERCCQGLIASSHALLGGQLTGQRLDLGHLHGGEAGRPTRPRPVGQSVHAPGGEPAAPLAGGVDGDAKPSGDPGVGHPAGGQQHDLGA
jgi:hypothetical protein